MRHLEYAVLALTLLRFPSVAPAQIPQHQGLESASDCSHCHADKTSGKSVHTAMELGCARCHQVVTDGKTTTIRLTMPKVQLCLACHLKSSDEYFHEPYVKGRCTSCHDPHSSDYPVHLRAETNTLCLQCHARQVVAQNSAVEQGAPRSGPAANDAPAADAPLNAVSATTFDSALQMIHGSAESFLQMMSALQDAHQPVLCLSCHQPHSSRQSKLLRSSTGPGL